MSIRKVALCAALVACGRESESPDPSGPTWYRDIAPIYATSCVTCHRDGGIAPFRLDDPETAQAWAAAAAVAVADRTMPPFLVTADGTCGEFADSEWLSDDAIALIDQWAAADAPLGDPADAPGFDDVPPRALGPVGLTAAIPPFTPSFEEGDEYRCFRIENDRTSDLWLTGYEGLPGNEALVHHIAVYTVASEEDSYVEGVTNGQLLAGLEGVDPRDGWSCYGAAGEGVRHRGVPATWAPGQGPVHYPEGTGYRLRPGDDVVVQLHYHPAAGPEVDTSRVDFTTADDVERELWFSPADAFLRSWILAGYGIGESAWIPAGDPAFQYSFPYTGAEMLADGGYDPASPRTFELVGVMPHMHERGRKEWLTVEGECAAEVRRWDFDWQRVYNYATPIPLDETSQVEVTCEWDSSGDTEDVLPGWGTDAEMCLMTMLFATER